VTTESFSTSECFQ